MLTNEGVIRLRDAIILSAVEEYKKSLATIKKLIERRESMIRRNDDFSAMRVARKIAEVYSDDVERLERFFRSQWFATLTTIKPESIIEHFRSEYGINFHPQLSSSISDENM